MSRLMELTVLLPFTAFVLCVYGSAVSERGKALTGGTGAARCCSARSSGRSGSSARPSFLSLAGALRFWPVAAAWMLFIGLVALLVRPSWQKARRLAAGPLRLSLPEAIVLAPTLLLCVDASLQGLVAPPNNWDSLAYHLPRQIYWAQHGSLSPWVTFEWRQLDFPPFAEFVGLHFLLLTGADHWANLVQWFAWVMTMVAASLITAELGGTRSASS